MKRKLLITGLVIFAIALGFLRDSVFVSINSSIETGNDDGGKLFIAKWILTIAFSILYLVITCLCLYIIFRPEKYAGRHRKYIWISIFSYAVLFLVSFIVGGAGTLISSFEKVYPFVRTVMGIAQSPVVMMILLFASFLNEGLSGKPFPKNSG